MLSEKEVKDLGERILGHVSLIEKYGLYARQTTDPQVRDILVRHQQVFQNHYQSMVGLVQNAQNITSWISTQAQWRPS